MVRLICIVAKGGVGLFKLMGGIKLEQTSARHKP
jgi:hypothetical protein